MQRELWWRTVNLKWILVYAAKVFNLYFTVWEYINSSYAEILCYTILILNACLTLQFEAVIFKNKTISFSYNLQSISEQKLYYFRFSKALYVLKVNVSKLQLSAEIS